MRAPGSVLSFSSDRTALYQPRSGSDGAALSLVYDGEPVEFTGDGWLNGTLIAARFGKRIDHWLNSEETKEYMVALAEAIKSPDFGDLIRTKRGNNGYTLLHPKLGVLFARYCDVRFAVWCDLQIDRILRPAPSIAQLPSPTSKRSTVADREPLFVLAGKCVARYGWRFTIVYVAMSLYAGSERFRTMDCAQVCAAADFAQHLLDGAVTADEWQRLAANRTLIVGESAQRSLFEGAA